MADGSTKARVRIDPANLAMFLAVADQKKVSAAAKALHRSQPAVTAQLRQFEEQLGTALFTRSVRGVEPTAAGRVLLGYARRIDALLDECANALDPAGESTGELRLGVSTTIAAHLLPRVLAPFRAKHPGVSITVDVGNTSHVAAKVIDGTLPLGLVEGNPRAPLLHLEPFADDEIVLVAAKGSYDRVTRARELSGIPMILREPGSGTRAVIDRALRAAGIDRAPRADDLVLASTEGIKASVLVGLGVAFLSRWTVHEEIRRGALRVIELRDLTVRRTFHWALPAGGLVGTAARFHAFAQRVKLPVPR